MSDSALAQGPVDRAPLRVVGGKAAALGELHAAGFRVPAFLVSPPDLEVAVRRLGTPLAVRSSATVEDGPRVSFAGQFKSFLNLRTLAEVEEAVCKCRDSVQSDSVLEYCRKNGIDSDAVRMEVI